MLFLDFYQKLFRDFMVDLNYFFSGLQAATRCHSRATSNRYKQPQQPRYFTPTSSRERENPAASIGAELLPIPSDPGRSGTGSGLQSAVIFPRFSPAHFAGVLNSDCGVDVDGFDGSLPECFGLCLQCCVVKLLRAVL